MPVFVNLEQLNSLNSFTIIDELDDNAIGEYYSKVYDFIKSINPDRIVIILNFTGLDYLNNKDKFKRFVSIDKAIKKKANDNLYFISHQNFSFCNYQDHSTELGTQMRFENHLKPEIYLRYRLLIHDLIEGKIKNNYVGSETILRHNSFLEKLI